MIDQLIENLKEARLFCQERYIKLNDTFNEDEWKKTFDTLEEVCNYLEGLRK